MKKLLIVLLIAIVGCTAVFAKANLIGNPNEANEGWWLGPSVTYLYQGVGATYDFGAFDVSGELGISLIEGIPAMIESPSFDTFLQMLLMDELRLSGYYSLVDANWFTFNVGAMLDVQNSTAHYIPDPETHPEKQEGWGGAFLALVSPALQLKFSIKNNVLIKATVNGTVLGLALGLNMTPYGCTDAQIDPMLMMMGLLGMVYNFANVCVEFKL